MLEKILVNVGKNDEHFNIFQPEHFTNCWRPSVNIIDLQRDSLAPTSVM
jgi:hypothetical protein